MSAVLTEETVDQLVFDYDAERGPRIVASSLTSPAEQDYWMSTLRARIPIQAESGLYRPPRTLTFLQLRRGDSALIRRAGRHQEGDAHVLVSRGGRMTTETALTLESWPGWRRHTVEPHLRPVRVEDLNAHAAEAIGDLTLRAERVRASIVTTMSSLLTSWKAPITIVGCPDSDRTPIIWAVRAIGQAQHARRAMRQWPFSTYELTDVELGDAQPFEIVFLPDQPRRVAGREIVDLGVGGRYRGLGSEQQAADLVSALLDRRHTRSAPFSAPPPVVEPVGTAEPPAPERDTIPIEHAGPRTSDRGVRGTSVVCPTCADQFEWTEEDDVWVWAEGAGRYMSTPLPRDSRKRADLRRRGYRRCPNPSGDTPQHYLPATYGDYPDPLVIGLVGKTSAGKTHLLTAMIREIHAGGLMSYGVQARSLDFRRHRTFQERFVSRLEAGEKLPATGYEVMEAADTLVVEGPGGTRAVTFFDVAGEDFARVDGDGRNARFLLAVDAAIFVCAPEDEEERSGTSAKMLFDLAVTRIRAVAPTIPAAIVLTKADRLRYVPPADRWLRRAAESELDAKRIRAESRDVYAYLHRTGSASALSAFPAFPRCTLHFVSASGRDATDTENGSRFSRGVQPLRVLEPLVAILAMTGVLTGPQAEQVGAP